MIKLVIYVFLIQVFLSEANIRVKRVKYSNPPTRFYKLPPPSYRVRGPYSVTPPPYMEDSHYPAPPSTFKVSRIEGLSDAEYPGYPSSFKVNRQEGMSDEEYAGFPSSFKVQNEGLGDEDLKNLIKHLSKKDLDKIFQIASKRDIRYKEFEEYNRPDDPNTSPPDYIENKPFVSNDRHNFEFKGPINYPEISSTETKPSHKEIHNSYLDTDESVSQYTFLDKYITQELNQNEKQKGTADSRNNKDNIYTESSFEQNLPKPENLREDYVGAHTKIVPSILRAESSYYNLENIGNLPLMNYENSKLESVDSYRVPHYTVTSPTRDQINPRPQTQKIPRVEPAPPASAARQQSDAHLSAVKIWTHKSVGTAYTLHDDGTLSLERPSRPNTKFY